MKMLKKILLGTLVLATALAFTSCGLSEDQEKAISRSGKVNYTNDGRKDFYRSFVSTETKHEDADAIITIEDADTIDTSEQFSNGQAIVSKGVFGFVFGLEQVKVNNPIKKTVDGKEVTVKFYNFGIVGVRWNAVEDKAQYYVSWCKNIPNTVFNYTNSSNFEDPELTGSGVPVAHEEVVLNWTDIPAANLDLNLDGNLELIIKTKASNNGGYEVQLYKESTKLGETAIANTVTGYDAKTQRLIGRYITVYKKQTVKGSIKYDDVNAGVIPEDDVGIVLE